MPKRAARPVRHRRMDRKTLQIAKFYLRLSDLEEILTTTAAEFCKNLRFYLLFFSTLKVSFSIFHLARPQPARSATVVAAVAVVVTARSVTKLLKYERLPLPFRISMENQLTLSASSVARSGTPDSQRQMVVDRPLPGVTAVVR